MKRTLVLLLLILPFFCISQNVEFTGTIKGNKINIDCATISVYNLPDSVLVGKYLSQKNGAFNIKIDSFTEQVLLVFDHVSFKKKIITYDIDKKTIVKLGVINLESKFYRIDEVNVSPETSFIRKLDRETYVFSENDKINSNTVLDLISKVPSIQTNKSSNSIQIEGSSSVQVFYNNKKVDFKFIQGIMPSTIAKIEILNNPSSKYLFENNTDKIINIIPISDIKYAHNIFLQLSSDLNNRYNNSNLNIDVYKNKFRFFLKGNYWYRNVPTKKTESIKLSSGERLTSLINVKTKKEKDYEYRYGMDYLHNRISINITGYCSNYPTKTNSEDKTFDSSSLTKDINNQMNNKLHTYKYSLFTTYKINDNGAKLSSEVNVYNSESNYKNRFSDNAMLEDNLVDHNKEKKSYSYQLDFNYPIAHYLSLKCGSSYYSNEAEFRSIFLESKDENNLQKFNSYIDFTYLINQKIKIGIGGNFMKRSYEYNRMGYNDSYFLKGLLLEYRNSKTSKLNIQYKNRIKTPELYQLNPNQTLEGEVFTKGDLGLKPEKQTSYKIGYTNHKNRSYYLSTSIFYKKMSDHLSKTFSMEDKTLILNYNNIHKRVDYGLTLFYRKIFSKRLNIVFRSNIGKQSFYTKTNKSNSGYSLGYNINLEYNIKKLECYFGFTSQKKNYLNFGSITSSCLIDGGITKSIGRSTSIGVNFLAPIPKYKTKYNYSSSELKIKSITTSKIGFIYVKLNYRISKLNKISKKINRSYNWDKDMY